MKVLELMQVVEDEVVVKTYMEDEDDLVVLQEFDLNYPMIYDSCLLLYGQREIDYCFIEDGKLTIVLL